MQTPKVSIIMAVYNGEEFLSDSILSVLNQTYKNFEFIVVNDSSTDNSLNILKDFQKKDERIKVINNNQNLGLTKSLNIGLLESKGEYIARLDAGDISLPERLERQVDFLDTNKNIGLIGTWMNIIDTKGNLVKEVKYPTINKELKKDLINYNPFVHSSIMFRRELAKQVGFYNEEYKYTQDYNFYFKLFPYTQFANIPMFLVKYRTLPKSITSTKNKMQVLFANKARIEAIKLGYYEKWNYIYVIKNYLINLIPTKIKFLIKKII